MPERASTYVRTHVYRNDQARVRARLQLLEQIVVELTPSASGEMNVDTDAAFPDITSATWVPVTQYDNIVPSAPRGVSLDIDNGLLRVEKPGVWLWYFLMTMAHDESNQGRNILVRWYNVEDAVGAPPITFAVGRNQPGSNIVVFGQVEIASDDVNNAFRAELQAESTTIANVVIEYLAFGAINIGRLASLNVPEWV